jgi:plastocyanin
MILLHVANAAQDWKLQSVLICPMSDLSPEFEMDRFTAIRNTALAVLFLASIPVCASAGDPVTYELTLKGKTFTPAEITVKAGETFRIKLTNANAMPAELESSQLGFEKVVSGSSDILVNVRAQRPGTYKFYDDFHPDEIVGHVVVQ